MEIKNNRIISIPVFSARQLARVASARALLHTRRLATECAEEAIRLAILMCGAYESWRGEGQYVQSEQRRRIRRRSGQQGEGTRHTPGVPIGISLPQLPIVGHALGPSIHPDVVGGGETRNTLLLRPSTQSTL